VRSSRGGSPYNLRPRGGPILSDIDPSSGLGLDVLKDLVGPVIHQVSLGWISSEPPKIEHFHVQNSEFRSSAGH
jgi:hypothetical protein